MVILAGAGLVFVGAEGWLPGSLPVPEVLLAPAAVALALSAGLGMAAFEVDLPDYHFGWRQIASLLAGAALVLAVLPAIGGRVLGPVGHADRRLRAPDQQPERQDRHRRALPGALAGRRRPAAGRRAGRSTRPRSTTSGPARCCPTPRRTTACPTSPTSIAGSDAGATSHLAETLQYAAEGGTSRLGRPARPDGRALRRGARGQRPEPARDGADGDARGAAHPARRASSTCRTSTWPAASSSTGTPHGARPEPSCPPTPSSRQARAGPADRVVPALTGAPTGAARRQGLRVVRRVARRGRHGVPGRGVVGPVAPAGRRPAPPTARRCSGGRTPSRCRPASSATLAFDTPISRTLMLVGQLVSGSRCCSTCSAPGSASRRPVTWPSSGSKESWHERPSSRPRRPSAPVAGRCWC